MFLPAIASGPATIDTVHHADCMTLLRALPDKSVDIVVTSPPYNIQWKSRTSFGMLTGARWVKDLRDGYPASDDHMPELEYQAWVRKIVAECMRVSKGLVWVNHKTRYRNGVAIHPLQFMPFPMWSEVVWDQGITRTFNSKRFAPSHEYFFGFGKPHYWDDRLNTQFSVWRIVPGASPDHPAPFPERVIEPLIRSSCPSGGIVLDPFMGSGTTGVVAKRLGRHFIGCDNAQEYVDGARQRIAAVLPGSYTLMLPDFNVPAPSAVQMEMFG